MFAIVKRYPLITFFSLTYIFLILGWIMFNEQISLGPVLSALIVVSIVGGREGLKDWARRIVHWRVGIRWYAAAILIPVFATGLAAFITILFGASYTAIQLSNLPELIPEALFIFLIVGLGEEPGFRGFVIPQLQAHFSAITSTAILVVLGIIWHLPLFFTGDSLWINMFVIVLGYLVFTWLFNNSGGSVLIAMLFHTSQAILGPQIFATMFSGADVVTYTWFMIIAYGAIVTLIVMTSRNRYLLFKPSEQLTNHAEQSHMIVSQLLP